MSGSPLNSSTATWPAVPSFCSKATTRRRRPRYTSSSAAIAPTSGCWRWILIGRGRAFADQHARARGCGGVDIRVVNLRDELPPFYRSLGYVETGRSEPVDDPGASKPYHFILMAKDLRL